MTGVVGAIVEAWDELRIHKLRVLLALGRRRLRGHRHHGRHRAGLDAQPVASRSRPSASPGAPVTLIGQRLAERGGRRTARRAGTPRSSGCSSATTSPTPAATEWTQALIRFPDGTRHHAAAGRRRRPGHHQPDRARAGSLVHRRRRAGDGPDARRQRGVPRRRRASPTSRRTPPCELGDRAPVTATVVGVLADDWPGAEPVAYVLYDQLHRWIGADGSGSRPAVRDHRPDPMMPAQLPTMNLWVPTDRSDEIGEAVARDLQAVAPGWQVDVVDNTVRQPAVSTGRRSGSASASAASRCCSAGSAW